MFLRYFISILSLEYKNNDTKEGNKSQLILQETWRMIVCFRLIISLKAWGLAYLIALLDFKMLITLIDFKDIEAVLNV